MPPTIRCTAIRRGASSTATTTATATCRFTCSAAGICWRPSCGRSNIDASGRRGRGGRAHRRADPRAAGRGCASCCAPTPGFAREELMAWCEANGVDYPVRAGPQRAARRPRSRPSWPQAEAEACRDRQAGAPLQGLHYGRRSTAGAAGAGSSPRPSGPAARPIRASSSPR